MACCEMRAHRCSRSPRWLLARRARRAARDQRRPTTTGATVTLAAPARRIVSLAPHATELLYAAGAGERVVGVLSTSDWPPEAAAKPRVGDAHRARHGAHRRARARPRRHLAVRGAGAGRGAARARRAGLHRPIRRRSTASPTTSSGWARWRARGPSRRRARAAFRAQLARLSAQRRGAPTRPRVLRDLERAALHDRRQAPDLRGDPRLRRRERVRVADAAGARRERRGGARGAAGGDHRRRRRCGAPGVARRLEALAERCRRSRSGNLYTVDANLLHRPGPRFLDGVEGLCAALDAARAAADSRIIGNAWKAARTRMPRARAPIADARAIACASLIAICRRSSCRSSSRSRSGAQEPEPRRGAVQALTQTRRPRCAATPRVVSARSGRWPMPVLLVRALTRFRRRHARERRAARSGGSSVALRRR